MLLGDASVQHPKTEPGYAKKTKGCSLEAGTGLCVLRCRGLLNIRYFTSRSFECTSSIVSLRIVPRFSYKTQENINIVFLI